METLKSFLYLRNGAFKPPPPPPPSPLKKDLYLRRELEKPENEKFFILSLVKKQKFLN